MENILKKINTICENATGNIYDIYFTLYKECILNQDNPNIILQKLFIEVQNREFNDEGDGIFINEKDVEEVIDLYFALLKVYVRTLVRENLEETEFYKRIYEVIFESNIFPQDEKTKAILLYLLSEKIPGIPYFQAVNLLEMTGEEYKRAVQRLRPQIEKAMDVMNRGFESRTEEASQIYEIILDIENREDKIVFLSVFINIVERNGNSCQ